MQTPVYFDHNATTFVDPSLHDRLAGWLELSGNPSSIHWAGRAPKAVIRDARLGIAQTIGASPLELIFTSGGSESNNLVLKGLCEGPPGERDQVIVSAVEHPSLLKAARSLKARGYAVDVIPVDRNGRLDLATYQSLLGPRTRLVSVMLANNETGHVFPVPEVARLAHAAGALVHCDAVQALGKLPLDVGALGVDFLSLSGHKFYALKGSGVLYVKRGGQLESQIHGGGQERGRRAGTENLLGIASLGAMCGRRGEVEGQSARLRLLRDHLERRILSEIADTHVTGPESERLPNTSSLVLEGVDGETLLMNLDVRGFAVSTGAACSSGNPEPSPTLLAMGLSRDEAQSSLRLSLGWPNTAEEVDRFVDELKIVVARLRGFKHGEKHSYGV